MPYQERRIALAPGSGWGPLGGTVQLTQDNQTMLCVEFPAGTTGDVFLSLKAPNTSKLGELPCPSDPEIVEIPGTALAPVAGSTNLESCFVIDASLIPYGLNKVHATLWTDDGGVLQTWACGWWSLKRNGVHGTGPCSPEIPDCGSATKGPGVTFTGSDGDLYITLYNDDSTVAQNIRLQDIVDAGANAATLGASIIAIQTWLGAIDADGDNCADAAQRLKTSSGQFFSTDDILALIEGTSTTPAGGSEWRSIYEYRDVWAEDADVVAANSSAFGFGHAPDDLVAYKGLPIDAGWEVAAVYFHADNFSAAPASQIDVSVVDYSTPSPTAPVITSISLASATDGGGIVNNAWKFVDLSASPAVVPANAVIGFRVNGAAGVGDIRVGVRLRRSVGESLFKI